MEKEENAKMKSESILYDFPSDYPGKERKEKIDKLESLPDDKAIIELDKLVEKKDKVIERESLSSVVEQEEKLIYFEVENIYSNPEKKAFRNRLKMRRNPPILVLKDNDGQEVKLKLTENLTDELSRTLNEVKRAYYGFSTPNDINKPEGFMEKLKFNLKKNKVKLISPLVVILLLAYIRIKMGG